MLGVVVVGFAEENPAHVRPPGAIAGRMRIAGLIGFLMMDAMRGDPENGSAFERQRAADGEEIFQPAGALGKSGGYAGGDSPG